MLEEAVVQAKLIKENKVDDGAQAKKRWKKAYNTIKTINRLTNYDAKKLDHAVSK